MLSLSKHRSFFRRSCREERPFDKLRANGFWVEWSLLNGCLSIAHLLILALVVLVLFGRGRISEMMGDFGKGIKSFKKGLNEEDSSAAVPPAQIGQNGPAAPDASPAPTTVESGKTSGDN